MFFAMIAMIAVVGVTLPSSYSQRAKAAIIGFAAILATGAVLGEVMDPNAPWSRVLSGLTMVVAAFAWAAKLERDQDEDLIVTSKCPFCDSEFTFHRDEDGKSRACSSCGNIFPNSGDQESLAEYARNARELMSAAEGSTPESQPATSEDEEPIETANDPIFGSRIQMDKND